MNLATANRQTTRVPAARWLIVGMVAIGIAWGAITFSKYVQERRLLERIDHVKIKRVISGHSVSLQSGERLNYAAIRAPYAQEPLHDEARRRNAEFVEGKEARVRFDIAYRDRNERPLGYVSAEGRFVNEALVRDGLAYVRLTPATRRFADRLLSAQADARKNRRGIWRQPPRPPESSYPADPKHGNFHRPTCDQVEKIAHNRLVALPAKNEAFDEGFAPCAKCLP